MVEIKFIATIEAKVPQVIPCTHCGEEFLYFMRQTGVGATERYLGLGAARAKQEAAAIAQRKLATKLHRNCFNVVPCPRCFRFPSFMRGQAVREKYGKTSVPGAVLVVLGGVTLVIGAFAAALSTQNRVAGLVALGAGLVVVLLGAWVNRAFRDRLATDDPNDWPEEERVELARERCSTWEGFNRKQWRWIAKQFHRHAATQKRERWLNDKARREPPPPIHLWLPPQAFADGLSITIKLANDHEVALDMVPGTAPGTTVDLVPAVGNEFPFQVILLAILEAPPQARKATKPDHSFA